MLPYPSRVLGENGPRSSDNLLKALWSVSAAPIITPPPIAVKDPRWGRMSDHRHEQEPGTREVIGTDPVTGLEWLSGALTAISADD
jgi:hypothetical protein